MNLISIGQHNAIPISLLMFLKINDDLDMEYQRNKDEELEAPIIE